MSISRTITMLLVLAVGSSAAAQVQRYENAEHAFAISAPDPLWVTNHESPIGLAQVVLSPPSGTAAVMVGHFRVPGAMRFDGPTRRSEFARYIRGFVDGMSPTGSSVTEVEESSLVVAGGRASMTFEYLSHEPRRSTPQHNRVDARLYTESGGDQHLYLIRATAPNGRFGLWEGDFGRAVASFAFTGSHDPSVYSSRAWPWWVWPAAAVALLVVLLFVRALRSSRQAPPKAPAQRSDALGHHTPTQTARSASATNAATASEHLGDHQPSTVSLHAALGGISAAETEAHLQAAETMAAVHEKNESDILESGQSSTFWTCGCGRVNPEDHEFCARCNADRSV